MPWKIFAHWLRLRRRTRQKVCRQHPKDYPLPETHISHLRVVGKMSFLFNSGGCQFPLEGRNIHAGRPCQDFKACVFRKDSDVIPTCVSSSWPPLLWRSSHDSKVVNRTPVVAPLPNDLNGFYPSYLLTGMILQVPVTWKCLCK